MKGQSEKRTTGAILEAHAARSIPDDRDLWPVISQRLQSRGRIAHQNGAALRTPWHRSLRRLYLTVGAAALLVAVLLASGFPPGSPQGASAEQALNKLAGVAAAQPESIAGPASGYRYIKSQQQHLNTAANASGQLFSALVPLTREMWVAADGSGRIRKTTGEPVFLSEKDRSAWQAAGSPMVRPATSENFGPGGLSYEDFSVLPTNPKALANAIRERAARADPPVDVEMFIVVGDILRQPGVPRELRAALYKVAAQIPGVELVGNVTDRIGRPGVAVAKTTTYWGGKQRLVLIFDPTTSALLGEEKVLLERADWIDAKPPIVIGYATYLESGMVTRLPD